MAFVLNKIKTYKYPVTYNYLDETGTESTTEFLCDLQEIIKEGAS